MDTQDNGLTYCSYCIWSTTLTQHLSYIHLLSNTETFFLSCRQYYENNSRETNITLQQNLNWGPEAMKQLFREENLCKEKRFFFTEDGAFFIVERFFFYWEELLRRVLWRRESLELKTREQHPVLLSRRDSISALKLPIPYYRQWQYLFGICNCPMLWKSPGCHWKYQNGDFQWHWHASLHRTLSVTS